MMRILVTGGAGFIGSAVIRHLIAKTSHDVGNIDNLTYAGNLESLPSASNSPRYHYYHVDICEAASLGEVFAAFKGSMPFPVEIDSTTNSVIGGATPRS